MGGKSKIMTMWDISTYENLPLVNNYIANSCYFFTLHLHFSMKSLKPALSYLVKLQQSLFLLILIICPGREGLYTPRISWLQTIFHNVTIFDLLWNLQPLPHFKVHPTKRKDDSTAREEKSANHRTVGTDKDNTSEKTERVVYETKIIGGVAVKTPVKKVQLLHNTL